MNKFIDLHTHSTASDGTFAPSELAKHAYKNGLCAVALTDHDSIDGVSEFCDACSEYGIEGICGTELSAKYDVPGKELHMVGLFIDCECTEFNNALTVLKKRREERNLKIISMLSKAGFDITPSDVLAQNPEGCMSSLGRPHIAGAMIEKGYAKSINEVFEKYIAKDRPYYVPRNNFSPEESIDIIHSAGGLAVLAHPISTVFDKNELPELLKRLKKTGLDALECYHSKHTEEFKDFCIDLCSRFDLLISGGSDFHGNNKPNVKIGKVFDDLDIQYDLLEKMKIKKGII